jgi:hypothetical protein
MVGFYTLQGFQDMKFAKFGPVDYFLCKLQDQDKFYDLNFEFEINFDQRSLTGRCGGF